MLARILVDCTSPGHVAYSAMEPMSRPRTRALLVRYLPPFSVFIIGEKSLRFLRLRLSLDYEGPFLSSLSVPSYTTYSSPRDVRRSSQAVPRS